MTRLAASSQEERSWTQEELDAMTAEELFQAYKRTGSEELKWPLVLRYEGEADGVTVMRQVWLTKDGLQPLCAEVYADGTRALLITFSDYREGAALPEPISEQPAEPGAEAAPEQAGPPAE